LVVKGEAKAVLEYLSPIAGQAVQNKASLSTQTGQLYGHGSARQQETDLNGNGDLPLQP
jgi:hypothetical protein